MAARGIALGAWSIVKGILWQQGRAREQLQGHRATVELSDQQ